jgi:hypothetical protein
MPPGVAEASMSADEHLERLRAFVMDGVNQIVDRALGEILPPDTQAAFCLDVAQFTTFLMAVKIADVRRLEPTAENFLRWYWPMQKALKDEVPGMLRQHAKAVAERANAHG